MINHRTLPHPLSIWITHNHDAYSNGLRECVTVKKSHDMVGVAAIAIQLISFYLP